MDIGKIIAYLFEYIFGSLVIMALADKTKTPKRWMAWIPIANIFLFLKIARKPASWFWWMIAPITLGGCSLLLSNTFANTDSARLFFSVLFLIASLGIIGASVLTLIAFASIIKILGKPAWMIILFFIPLVNLFFICYLAFAESVVMSNPENISSSNTGEPVNNAKKL